MTYKVFKGDIRVLILTPKIRLTMYERQRMNELAYATPSVIDSIAKAILESI